MNLHRARARRVLYGTALALTILPAGAQAATLSLDGGTLAVTGTESTSAPDQIQITSSYFNSTDGWIQIYDGAAALAAPAGCQNDGANYVKCPPGSITRVVATLGAGNDGYAQYYDGIVDQIDGGAGNDTITGQMAGDDAGKEAVDTISGGAGDDDLSAGSGSGTTLNGGDGNDSVRCYYVPAGGTCTVNGGGGKDNLQGGASNDVLNGEAGDDDRISGGDGNDVIDGGDGNDGVDYLYGGLDGGAGADVVRGGAGVDELHEDRNQGVTQFWSLDGAANDGADADGDGVPEEGDNVHADVENVESGYDNDVIVGSAAGNKIYAGTLGDDVVRGLGGDDDVNGGVSGADSVDGGDGNDKVAGNGHLVGGLGNDELTGYGDNGLLEPGPGIDSVSAGAGNDVVKAVDGEVDTIGCGVGADIAEVDGRDVVNTNDDGDNCEQVKVTQGAQPSTGGQDPTGNPNAGAVALILGSKGSVKGSFARFGVTAPAAGIIRATVTPAGKARKASIARRVVLGRAMKAVGAAGKVALKIKLKGKAARKLKRKKAFKVKLTTVFTPVGGSAQPKVTKTVKLKRRR